MAYTLTLDAVRGKMTYLAGLDGKTGANSRHSPTNMGLFANMAYRDLMSRSGQLGLPHGLFSVSGTLGTQQAGEDFVSLDIPATASEVVGIDVRGAPGSGNRFVKLDPVSWEQRRDIEVSHSACLCAGLEPPHGAGFWTVREGPSVSGSTLTQGKLAIWPPRLAGLPYSLSAVRQWVEITSGTDVFLLHEGWESWLIAKAAMFCCTRDTNKRTNYDTCRDALAMADEALDAQSRRLNRAGGGQPTPYMGIRL